MPNDPIVNEIRWVRHAYAQAFDNNLHAICEDLKRQERESNREVWAPLLKNTGHSENRVSLIAFGSQE
uniref:Uncharacterized protein n=1 Tax=Candidatus Kentrum sp. LPFa TaxID=2126335 RepID=A0A450Y2V2_9GAMM|nr:MAG: hypothetical protein BECKLPF1236A_GA0070988_104353 [Candidatus Kentron sp. LPFa]VFK35887.1 MAG: hypothetical protein BECKLPF1236C_GA0070990_104413 [Candidatus Kentron sp. LPFa]